MILVPRTEHGQALVYASGARVLRLDGLRIESVDLASGEWTPDDARGFSRITGLSTILHARVGAGE